MAIDLTKNTYKITKDPKIDGIVHVIFDVDGKEQHIAGAPLDSDESLLAFLDEYLAAYKAGLAIEQPTSDASISALVNKQQTAVVPEPETATTESQEA